MIKSLKFFPLLAIIIFLLSGCSALERAEQSTRSNFVSLSSQVSLGQTFSARYRGLKGISFFFKPSNTSTGTITLHLRSNPQDTKDIETSQLSVGNIYSSGYYPIYFASQSGSFNRDYYIQIDSDQSSSLEVGSASGDTYLQGALYLNGIPQNEQLTFKLIYDPFQVAIGVGLLIISWFKVILISIFLFIIPGWALLGWLYPDWVSNSWLEKSALSAGVSLAIYPLFFLWSNLLGLHLGSLYAWLPPLIGIVLVLWRFRAKSINLSDHFRHVLQLTLSKTNISRLWPDLALIITLGLIVAVRFWVIRNLSVPLWGDSYQHTLITQLLIDNRGIFNSWQPYAALQTFTYHFGFHTLAAVFIWITKQPASQATLWTGQIINILAVLTLYPLATKIGGNRWAGVGALLLAGLFVPMPMYYVNWGRYTQLAGQVILPVALYLIWKAIEGNHFHWGLVSLGWILWSGLALTHYRVLLFAILFLFALFLVYITKSGLRLRFLVVFSIAAGAALLFLPWFIRVFSGKIITILGKQISTPPIDVSAWTQQYNAIGNISTYLPIWVWLLTPVLICWGLWAKKRGIAIISLWWVFMVVAANPSWLRLPGEGALSNFAVFIAAYIPAGIIAGAALGWTFGSLSKRINNLGMIQAGLLPGFFFVIALSAFWTARQRVNDLDLKTSVLFTRPDARASAWIQENLPQKARFLVNSMPAYGDTLIVGTDGGWWLPLSARRETTLPPINYGTEQGPQSQYRQWINQLTQDINQMGLTDQVVIQELMDRDITYVYIGQRQGRVNNGGPIIESQTLQDSPFFQQIYHQDLVWIFKFNPP